MAWSLWTGAAPASAIAPGPLRPSGPSSQPRQTAASHRPAWERSSLSSIAHQHGAVAPDWPTGIALGLGGLAGGYTGARLQARLPDVLIRRLLGVLVAAIGIRYLWSGLS
jgi:hypothetical protein